MSAHRAWMCRVVVLAAGFVVVACSTPTQQPTGVAAERAVPANVEEASPPTSTAPLPTESIATATDAPTTTSPDEDSLAARQVLGHIRIRPEHGAGFERGLFSAERDADGDGCSTRAEVLLRDAVDAPTTGRRCALAGGQWHSELDALELRGTSQVEVDHVVSLKEAWDSGAWRWTRRTRAAFANDLTDARTLQPTSADANRSKSDKDPSNWLPPNSDAVCAYIGDWVAIKARWKLSMDESEWGRVKNVLDERCSGHRIERWPRARVETVPTASTTTTTTTTTAPPPPPPPPPTTVAVLPVVPQPPPGCDPNYTGCVPIASDVDCAGGSGNGPAYVEGPVRIIGADPYGLDADGDGIGCED
jgi:hypothetical protein